MDGSRGTVGFVLQRDEFGHGDVGEERSIVRLGAWLTARVADLLPLDGNGVFGFLVFVNVVAVTV